MSELRKHYGASTHELGNGQLLVDARQKIITVSDHSGRHRLGYGDSLPCPDLLSSFNLPVDKVFA